MTAEATEQYPIDPARPRTLAEKVWDAHLVKKGEDGTPDLI